MNTTLIPGSVFVMRDRGSYSLWRVADHGRGYTGVGRPLNVGERIHFCVWKGDMLVPRKDYVLKPGDVTWQSTGLLREKYFDRQAQMRYMESVMDAVSAFFNGQSAQLPDPANLPDPPATPNYPVTPDYYVFRNRFGGTCPVWLKECQ